MAQIPGTPTLESRNCPEIVSVGVPGLWEVISSRPDLRSRRGLKQSCNPRRDLFNAMSHAQIGRWEEVDSRLLVVGSQTGSWLPALLLPITWVADVRIANARAFSISTFQNLFNDTKNTPMQGVLPLAVELWTFGSPGRLPTSNFSKCWASPPHLTKVGLRQLGGRATFKGLLDCLKLHLPAPFNSVSFLTRGYFEVLFELQERGRGQGHQTTGNSRMERPGLLLFSLHSKFWLKLARGGSSTHTRDLHEQFRNTRALTIMASKIGEVLEIEAVDSYIKRPTGPMITIELRDISKLLRYIRIPSMAEGVEPNDTVAQRI